MKPSQSKMQARYRRRASQLVTMDGETAWEKIIRESCDADLRAKAPPQKWSPVEVIIDMYMANCVFRGEP